MSSLIRFSTSFSGAVSLFSALVIKALLSLMGKCFNFSISFEERKIFIGALC